MRVKEKRILKNGAVAGYVYYSKEKKWKWRIINGSTKQKGGIKVDDHVRVSNDHNEHPGKEGIILKIFSSGLVGVRLNNSKKALIPQTHIIHLHGNKTIKSKVYANGRIRDMPIHLLQHQV